MVVFLVNVKTLQLLYINVGYKISSPPIKVLLLSEDASLTEIAIFICKTSKTGQFLNHPSIFFVRRKYQDILPRRQIKYPVDFDVELKTRKRQIR